jgi:hypothetical protein
VRLAADAPEKFFTAKCPGYSLEPRIPCLVRRTTGGRVTFAAVYDWAGDDQGTLSVNLIPDGVELRTASGASTVRFADKGVTIDEKR